MIKAVRIQNLRSLKDTGFIEIKPLTILLGTNSSGKSTFLRSFLLFTQSVNKRLRGPISWFDDSLVDFGDFYTALNAEAKENGAPIRFHFRAEKASFDRYPREFGSYTSTIRNLMSQNYEFSISLACDEGETYINEVTLKDGDLDITASISGRNDQVSFTLGNKTLKTSEKLKWTYSLYNSILPSFEHKSKDVVRRIGSVTEDELVNFVKERSSNNLTTKDKIYMLFHKSVTNKEELLEYLKSRYAIKSFSKYVRLHNWTTRSKEFNQLYGYLALSHFLNVFSIIDLQLASFYSECSYIAPARAEANRYYRTQGLQVIDVDPYGRNLQEFISSLDGDQKSSYQEYTEKLLKVIVDIEVQEGHQSIVLKSEHGKFNMADVGFGYSQILPIVTKLWYASNTQIRGIGRGRVFYRPALENANILIEQPELHLHPAYQAKIADAIMDVAKKAKKEKRRNSFVVETHSEVFINRLGRRIMDGSFSKDDVSIVLFNKKIKDKNTSVKVLPFKENGYIQDWPYGFFDPDND